MGIGGSGISGVALMAKRQGYVVTGCDLQKETAYISKVGKEIKRIFKGHDEKHLRGIDLLVTSPAIFYKNNSHPEIVKARENGILVTWQKFLGTYILKNKKVICISGTHGKSTTTAIVSLMLEKAGKDPSAIIGATVKEWQANFRIGKSDFFIVEADEFNDNFLNYYPQYLVINNIEFDHPDYFNSIDDILISFDRFIRNLTGERILIINQDSSAIKTLMKKIDKRLLKTVKLYGYSLESIPLVKTNISLKGEIVSKSEEGTNFKVYCRKLNINNNFSLKIPGEYNVDNALGVILLGKLLSINDEIIQDTLSSFNGVERRLELVGERKRIKIYDDYAHHPTAVKATLQALRQLFPRGSIWAVVEPHSFSRTKALLSGYKGAFENANRVVIGPIFKARDSDTFGVNGQAIADASGHKQAIYLDSLEKIINLLKSDSKPSDVIIVMGAGESYKWSRKILNNI